MQFTRLRLSGFKSFVDQTDLVIAPGLTGIVGPNGCGKSNLVEALRWVMGETSAKRMRGTEMDDVIFGGTSDRPPRNLAEVTLTLDNQARTAPAAFNAFDQLEVRRKIEREKGSDYRVNGKPTRARDVQLLFQDNSTGSNSPALVSQGRVGALIGAKPADRRLLLEDAAGVAGLHSRRHEAELRLRAAESNLERLEDVVRAMDGQLGSLKRQAKQAQRYRELSEKIRTTEAALMFLNWETADRRLAAARHGHGEADKRVGEAMQVSAAAATAQAEAATQVPPAREREAESAASLQRLIIAREQVQAEAKRIRDQTKDTEQRLVQLQGDLAREASLGDDAAQALARLAEEETQIRTVQSGEGAAVEAAEAGLAGAQAVVESLEGDLTRLTEAVATDEATARALAKQVSEQQSRHQSLTGKVDAARAERDRLAAATAQTQAALTAADEALAAAEAALIEKRAAAEAADQARMSAEQTLTETRGTFQQLDQESGRLKAEAAGLSQALSGKGSERQGTPILDRLQVDAGAESALGAAFAEDLSAPGERLGARWWEALPPLDDLPPLPSGISPLATRVSGPAALHRALGLVGIAPDRETALALAGALRAGQSLVTLEGDFVRWDGFTVLAGAPSAAAVRLQQRNRLAALEAEIEGGKEALESARRAFDAARTDLGAAAQAATDGRRAADAAFQARNRAAESQTRQARAAGDGEGRRVQAARRAEELAGDLEAVAQALSELRANEAALPDLGQRREDIAQLRRQVAEARGDLATAQATREGLKRETDARRDRLNRIETERRSWTDRASGAGKRIRELEARRDTLGADLEKLKAEPSRLSAQLSSLADRIDEAELRRKRFADALALAETAQRDTDRTLKDAEQRLAQRREARLSAEAEVRAAHTALEALADRIQERLDCGPDRLAALAGLDPAAERPHPKTVESQMQRLLGERDALGPVNLRAEQESEELDEQVQALKSEREDLIAAIARLRQGIAGLNKEAKERLLAAFDLVHGHFSDLFVRLFGGGKAELKLTDPEDPLACGLEIYASPPGKRLQHLSLLSGGEQALTAVALLFAVFLTKPSPICVLDEVDAPLDDANVDRFCTLVEELAKEARTRFLVITHHRMTMARADRLFGVTMGERGVSQLVSVDLEAAARLRDDILG